MRQIFTFPNPVNEISARVVASGVVAMSLTIIFFEQYWLLIPLSYGFLARTISGPRFSPLALLSVKVITPLVPAEGKLVPGPPKRFAQGCGALMSTSAMIAYFSHQKNLAIMALLLLIVAASMEAIIGLCLGCKIFNMLIKWNMIPESVCESCSNIASR